MMHTTYGGNARAVRRTGALRKGSTLPANLSGLLNMMPESEESGEHDQGERDPGQVNVSSQTERRRAKSQTLSLAKKSAFDFDEDDSQLDNDNHRSSDDGHDDESDFDDFTDDDDDDDDDEIIYENPVGYNNAHLYKI